MVVSPRIRLWLPLVRYTSLLQLPMFASMIDDIFRVHQHHVLKHKQSVLQQFHPADKIHRVVCWSKMDGKAATFRGFVRGAGGIGVSPPPSSLMRSIQCRAELKATASTRHDSLKQERTS